MLEESFDGEKIEPTGESSSASSQVGLLFGFEKVQALEDEAEEEENDGEGGLRKVHLSQVDRCEVGLRILNLCKKFVNDS